MTANRACLVLVLLALVVAARGLERRTTWYLASDQFAFLTFADDLRRGHVFHDPGAFALLAAKAPRGEAVDAYSHTYLWRDGRLYSRYPPGFPLLLALAGAAGGERAQHLLNPILYLVLLAALALFTRRLVRGTRIAAGAAAAAPWALLVVPAEVHYWGLTVARDLPAHLLALGALAAACAGRFTIAGLALGFACSIRPDALLYSLSLGAVALVVRPSAGALGRGSLAFLAGVAPLLAYNAITQGHPLAFTQGMEFRHLLGRAPGIATASVVPPAPPISGGGFRLRNLPQVLPQNVRYLAGTFGLFLLPALGALAGSLRQRGLPAAALAPYLVGSVLFYSCWGHGDARYLVGAVLALLVATAIGTSAWCATLAEPARPRRTRLAFLALTLAAVLAALAVFPPSVQRRPLEVAVGAGVMLVGAAALAPPLAATAAALAPFVPALTFAGVGLTRVATGAGARDPFQAPQVQRAVETVEALVPPGALVITTPALGRPAENIAHYTHADAHYEGELAILRLAPAEAAFRVVSAGRRVFLLLPAGMPAPIPAASLREVSRRRGTDLYDWFVDPGHAAEAVLLEVVLNGP